MAKSKKSKKKKSKKRSKKSVLKKTLKKSSIAAIIYAIVVVPALLVGGFLGSLAMKIINSVLVAAVAVLTILIVNGYLKLSVKEKFTNTMAWIVIAITVIAAVFNILKLYIGFSQIIMYVITWVTAAIYILFGISLFKMKKLNIMFSIAAIFYLLIGVFNATLVLMVLAPSLYLAKGVIEAFLFKRLSKKA